MNPVMYLIVDSTLKMSRGKEDAQVAHAAVEAYRISDQQMIDDWRIGGHYTKIVLQSDADDFYTAQAYIEARGFDTEMIIDEGRTEFDGRLTPTVLGVEIVDKDDPHVRATFETFKLRKDAPVQWATPPAVHPATLLRGRTVSLKDVIPYLDEESLRRVNSALDGLGSTPSGPERTLYGYTVQARANLAMPGRPNNWQDITSCIRNKGGECVIDHTLFLDCVEAAEREGR